MDDPILELKDIYKKFGNINALNGVNLNVHANSITALCGDNGAGKSTLIKIISGALIPDKGDIFNFGKSVKFNSPKDAHNIGIETVYQDLALCENLNVIQNLFLGREVCFGLNRFTNFFLNNKNMHQKAKEVFDILGTTIPSYDNQISHLSGGQKQAVAIARAIAWGSKIVILDEPTAALGVEQTINVHNIILNLKAKGIGVVIITHNIQDVFKLANRVVVLRQGLKVSDMLTDTCTPEDVVKAITGTKLK